MAMNKKEQAEMDRLRDELRTAKSFRFTETVEPDVPIPSSGYGHKDAVNGFGYNHHTETVYESCSTCISHSSWGHSSKTTLWSQNAIRQYSTRLLALRGLRHALEQKFALKLADIDREIEEEVEHGRLKTDTSA